MRAKIFRVTALACLVTFYGASTNWVHPAMSPERVEANASVEMPRAADDPETAGGAIFRSVDGGNSWQRVSKGVAFAGARSITIDLITPTTIYAGTFGTGVFKSTDRGNSWTEANSGLTDLLVYALIVDTANPSTLYAATSKAGVFKSTDGGRLWSNSSEGLPGTIGFPDNIFVRDVAVDPQTPSTVYAAVVSRGIFKSIDGGDSWLATSLTRPSLPDAVVALSNLIIDPIDPSILYVANYGDVFRSTDGGDSWRRLPVGDVIIQTLAIDPQSPSTIYAATFSNAVYKSVDGGQSWNANRSGLSLGHIFDLAIDPKNPSVLYAGVHEETTPQVPGTAAAAPGVFFGGGISRSTDGGASWLPANTGLSSLQVLSLAIDSTDPTILFAGTEFMPGFLRPVITSAERQGKALLVTGENFKPDAVLLIDGEPQKTRNDGEGPASLLIAKKAGKKIKRGQTVRLEVLNQDGRRSDEFPFSRPD